ncbi:MAG: hypothetical protein QM756_13260 [Polyangiaceae bacterium]
MLKTSLSLAFGLLLCGAKPAFAAPDAPPIRVVLRSCAEIHEAEVERIVSAELGSQAASDAELSSDPTWIVASCAGSRVLIEVGDVVSRKTLRRSFTLDRAPAKARARLIAIAASELVLASWAELALRPKLRVEPEGPAPSTERAEAARARASNVSRERPATGAELELHDADGELAPPPRQRWLDELPPERRRFRITALGSLRTFLNTEGSLLGGGVRLSDERLVLTCWSLDALYETGTFFPGGQEYQLDSWSLGGMLYLYARGRYVTGRAGAGLRAGLSVGTPQKPENPAAPSARVLTPWGWPMLALGLSLGRKPITFELSAEGSYVAVPLAPTAQGGVSLRGIWISGQVGLGLVL